MGKGHNQILKKKKKGRGHIGQPHYKERSTTQNITREAEFRV